LAILALFVTFSDHFVLSPLRFILGVLLALFLPGYILISIIFAERPPNSDSGQALLSRVILSVALSIVIVPALAIALQHSGIGIKRVPIAIGLCGITILLSSVAVWRRLSIPPERRFCISDEIPSLEVSIQGFREIDRFTLLLTGLIVIALLLASGAAVYAVSSPSGSSASTEFYLLSENQTGAFVASGYPTEFVQGQPERIGVGIKNNEAESKSYVLLVAVQQTTERSKDAEVIEREVLQRLSISLTANDRTVVPINTSIPTTGDSLQLMFELHESGSGLNEPYRETYLWVNVTGR